MRLRNAISAPITVAPSTALPTASASAVLAALGMIDGPVEPLDQRDEPATDQWSEARRLLTAPPANLDVQVIGRAAVRRQSNSKFAAQLRQLLARFSGSPPEHGGAQSIVMSGVGARRSSSLVASSLAVTCAASGFQVLLVDANLSHPSLHSLFGVNNGFGLADLLESNEPPNLLVQATSIPNLAILPAGMRTSNYASLLTRQSIVHRLGAIASAFDYIIIDASALPPTLLARAAIKADQVAIAVTRHQSSMRELERTVRLLREEGIDNSSVLIIE